MTNAIEPGYRIPLVGAANIMAALADDNLDSFEQLLRTRQDYIRNVLSVVGAEMLCPVIDGLPADDRRTDNYRPAWDALNLWAARAAADLETALRTTGGQL